AADRLAEPDPLDANPAGPQGPDEHGRRPGGARSLLRPPPDRVRLERALGNEKRRRPGKRPAPPGAQGRAAGRRAPAEKKSVSENPQPRLYRRPQKKAAGRAGRRWRSARSVHQPGKNHRALPG